MMLTSTVVQVFGDEATQEEVYDATARDIVEAVIAGYNGEPSVYIIELLHNLTIPFTSHKYQSRISSNHDVKKYPFKLLCN